MVDAPSRFGYTWEVARERKTCKSCSGKGMEERERKERERKGKRKKRKEKEKEKKMMNNLHLTDFVVLRALTGQRFYQKCTPNLSRNIVMCLCS